MVTHDDGQVDELPGHARLEVVDPLGDLGEDLGDDLDLVLLSDVGSAEERVKFERSSADLPIVREVVADHDLDVDAEVEVNAESRATSVEGSDDGLEADLDVNLGRLVVELLDSVLRDASADTPKTRTR